eukprot:2226306-Alexandrium_andersonii.AAC.1
MDSGSDLLGDLLGPLSPDDSLVRSADHDSSGLSMQRQVTGCSTNAASHPTHAMVRDTDYAGVRSG